MLNHQKKGQQKRHIKVFFFHRERYKICSPFPGVKTSCYMHCGVWMVVQPQEVMLYVFFVLKLAFGLTKNYPHIPVYICLWYLMQSQILWCLYGFQNLKKHICPSWFSTFQSSKEARARRPISISTTWSSAGRRLGCLGCLGMVTWGWYCCCIVIVIAYKNLVFLQQWW